MEHCEIKNISEYEKEAVEEIIKCLSGKEIRNFDNMILIGRGSYSRVFKIGDYVLKLGAPKINCQVIECDLLIETFFRRDFYVITNNIKRIVGIELQRYAKEVWEIDEEKLYAIYVILRRNYKMIWQDIKKENLGVYNNRVVIIDTDEFYNEGFTINNSLSKKFANKYEEEF